MKKGILLFCCEHSIYSYKEKKNTPKHVNNNINTDSDSDADADTSNVYGDDYEYHNTITVFFSPSYMILRFINIRVT